MEKERNKHSEYRALSRGEAKLLKSLADSGLVVFRRREATVLGNLTKSQAYNLLIALEKKGAIFRVRNGRYTVSDNSSSRALEIATEAVKPSYVSFWSALSYYGFTEQQVSAIQLVSTKQLRAFSVGIHHVEVAAFLSARFYGYERVGGCAMADVEKALVDSLHMPQKCGGMDEYAKCLETAWGCLNKARLAEYAVRFGSRSLVSRLGCLMELLGLKDAKAEKVLMRHRSSSRIELEVGGWRPHYPDLKWNVYVNWKPEAEKT